MRNVIVTGGSRGLGLAIVERLSAAGFRVIAIARRDSQELAKLRAAMAPGAIASVAFDLGDIDGLASLVKDIRKTHGAIYGLVNNAGIGTEGLLSAMPLRDIEQLLRLNTLSPIVLTRQVVRSMMAAGEGRIVNLSSIAASTGYSALSVYAATKASIVGFTRSLARELGRAGITVNAVAPGFIDTAMTEGLTNEGRDKIARRSALQRLAEPADVARTVEFLLGEGGRNITGTVITVDAGNTA
ncbi:MAG: SDR family oxidoreductase [Rhizobiales bacterium]|nr:SDR family oxidoreductase [Hyphomicrobiales bacterium]